MAQDLEKKQSKIETKLIKELKRNENIFKACNYCGKGKENIGEISGSANVLLVSPFSVSIDNMQANPMTGGLTRLLAYKTGCSALFTQKKFENDFENIKLKKEYAEKIRKIHPSIIIELRTIPSKTPYFCVDTPTVNYSDFLNKVIKYVIEYELDEEYKFPICETVNDIPMSPLIECANNENIPILILGINKDGIIENNLKRTYSVIKKLILLLMKFDWTANYYDVFKIWQASSKSQIPQDKVEFINTLKFVDNALMHLNSFEGIQEIARVNKINEKTKEELISYLKPIHQENNISEYIILTNRLIENLFGREWIEGFEEKPGLCGAPVIVYENKEELYEIGVPKANQVNGIALSTELYKEKIKLSQKYDYMVFNRYTDSRIYIDLEKADYGDNGRVKAKDGAPNAKKVMLPRYYRLMLGYLDKPLKIIRDEEYLKIVDDISKNGNKILENDFKQRYTKMPGQAYHLLIEVEKENLSKKEFEDYTKSIGRITEYFQKLGAYSYVELIAIPKIIKSKKISEKISEFWTELKNKILETTIGKAEYILKTTWADDTDDKNNVARLNNNMMSLIGISENDKLLISFGEKTVVLRVLSQDNLSDYEIGIPSSGRRALGMNSINDIVIVYRDMSHTFKRHSQEQTIAILGTVLAVVQVLTAFDFFTESLIGKIIAIVICIIAIILMLYFALNEERIKVK